jgi:hypothetical protein
MTVTYIVSNCKAYIQGLNFELWIHAASEERLVPTYLCPCMLNTEKEVAFKIRK